MTQTIAVRLGSDRQVGALLQRPASARVLMVLAHGAGAGMSHPFMGAFADRLASHDVATLRYQFPYMESGTRRIDPQPVLLEAVRAAVATAQTLEPELPLFAGGKSMGGRMTTLAASSAPLGGVRGIVLVGFPLHGMGQAPNTKRAEHLRQVTVPMLFLQGTRDTLADLDLMRNVCTELGERARLHVIEGGDHSFHVLKKSGRTDQEALDELAQVAANWMLERVSSGHEAAPSRRR
jgi:hypothetical protein